MKNYLLSAGFALGANAVTISLKGSQQVLGSHVSDARFGAFINDGGTGGKINGINLLALSDVAHPGQFPLHTAYAYLDPNNPNNCSVIGNYKTSPPSLYTGNNGGVINYIAGVDPPDFANEYFAPAPRVAPIPIPGNSTGALCVWPIHKGSAGAYSYNTMFELNVLPQAQLEQMNSNVPAVRTKPILFNVTAGQSGYGSKALTSLNNNFFYAWEGDSTGFKLALVPWGSRTDTTSWFYWHNEQNRYIQNQPLARGDNTGNVYNLTGYGGFELGFDARYVDHFGTYIVTFQNENAPGSSLYAIYSTSGRIEGPYTQPEAIFSPQYDYADCNNTNGPPTYGVQAHWEYFGTTSNQLLVSWVSCASYINMGILTFSS